MFIHFFFNTRPKEIKDRFFKAVADEVTERAGLRREDLLMAITGAPWKNLWTYGRTVDPTTGFDTRMKGQVQWRPPNWAAGCRCSFRQS